MGRDNNIYSFSHLTFHEYFAAREAKEKAYFTSLTEHLTEKRWREVILLTVGMLPEANRLLTNMKQAIDSLFAGWHPLQKFLTWAQQKAESVNVPYKSEAIRAFYSEIALGLTRETQVLARDLDHTLAHALDLDRALDIDIDQTLGFVDQVHDRVIDLALNLDRARDVDTDQARILEHVLECSHVLALDRALNDTLNRILDLIDIHDHTFSDALTRRLFKVGLDRALDCAIDRVLDLNSTLKLKLKELSAQLLSSASDWDTQEQWWQDQGPAWIEQLRAVMIEHRNIGHDWQLSEAQTQRLQQYYEANQLLVACLNSDCYVSRAVREEIEDTLLLPLAEIERRRTS